MMLNPEKLKAVWRLARNCFRKDPETNWDWIQLEVTSDCPAACIYCPHTIYRNQWSQRHFPLDLFRRLLPTLARARLLYLQGWGEPLCHPSFIEMVALAKNAGCRVGTSTNGMLLKESTVESLLTSGIDLLTFSLAGTGRRNDLIRRGTDIESVLDAIRQVRNRQAELGIQNLQIHIAYMLLRSELDQLNHLPDLLDAAPVDQVVVSTLDFLPDPGFSREALFCKDFAEFTVFRNHLDEIRASVLRKGIDFHYYLGLKTLRRLRCTENIGRSLFVGVDGNVSPCVFTNLPLRDHSCIQGYQPKKFGNVNLEELDTIWEQPEYRSFRSNHPPEACAGCSKLHLILDGDVEKGEFIE